MKSYDERLADAKLYNEQCKKKDMHAPDQLFKTGQIVRVANNLGSHMSHFPGKGKEAVVEYSYNQRFGAGKECSFKREHQYSLVILDDKGTPISSVSWYYESQLTMVHDDIELGMKLIEIYESKL